jgi:hypothetical protein
VHTFSISKDIFWNTNEEGEEGRIKDRRKEIKDESSNTHYLHTLLLQ